MSVYICSKRGKKILKSKDIQFAAVKLPKYLEGPRNTYAILAIATVLLVLSEWRDTEPGWRGQGVDTR